MNNAILNNFILQDSGGKYEIPISTSDLLFYVDANRYSGTGDWLDETGNGYDFTGQNSPSFTSGSNSYFTLDNAGSGNDEMFLCQFTPAKNMDQWSVHIWLYMTGNGNETYQTVFDKDSDEELCYLYGDTDPEMAMWAPNIDSGYNITDGLWLNLVWTYVEDSGPGDNGICKFFENGVRVPTPTSLFNHNDGSSSATQFTIGGGYSGGGGGSPNEVMDGRIGECGLYEDLALSDGEVLSNFNATKARYGY